MDKQAPILRSDEKSRRGRKALLCQLTEAVKFARSLDDGDDTEQTPHTLLTKAYKVVLRGAKYYEIWSDAMGLEQTVTDSTAAVDNVALANGLPLTPPAEGSSFSAALDSDQGTVMEMKARSRVSLANSEAAVMQESRDRANSRHSRASLTSVRPGTSQSILHSSRPTSLQTRRASTSHRASFSTRSPKPHHLLLVSERLSTLHDTFLGSLGSFIALHLPSRTSTEVLVTTRDAVRACQNLLKVVETIWERDLCRSETLEAARDNMVSRLTDLYRAAHNVFQPTSSWDRIPGLGEDAKLKGAATFCIQGAGECVAEARFVLEKIGDFEFETVGLGISTFEGVTFEPSATIECDALSDCDSVVILPAPFPPQPTSQPPAPPSRNSQTTKVDTVSSYIEQEEPNDYPESRSSRTSRQSVLSPLPNLTSPTPPSGGHASWSEVPLGKSVDARTLKDQSHRSESADLSTTGSTYIGSGRDSKRSLVSSASTRATSLDASPSQTLFISRSPDMHGSPTVFDEESLSRIHEKTYAHELVFKDGQIIGGSLPALVERLTTEDSTPDALFVSTFYLTFRLFASPCELAQTLIDRFNYVSDSPHIATPVRLRVFNAFKGWLESHWRMDCDKPALDLIISFAAEALANAMPSVGKRLMDLTLKVSTSQGPLVPRLVSSIGKTNTALASYVAPDTPLPDPIISKSQLSSLRNWKKNGSKVSILDFEPLEIARQFTIKESQIFCSILPEELLATEWTKKSGSLAVNVRAMSTLSTDVTNLVQDSILQQEDANKRAKLIKRWVKIAACCLELRNYDCIMAIVCGLNSTTILRMKRTWDLIAAKTTVRLDQLKSVVDLSRNYTVLRTRLQQDVAPCLPFVGMYLTDLTFVDAGNPAERQLPGSGCDSEKTISVINFDKHMKTAKIISDLQRFQIPYRLQEVPELQTWIQDQLVKVRSSDEASVQSHYRRSLILEPREATVKGDKKERRGSQDKRGSQDTIEVEKPEKEKTGKGLLWPYPSRDRFVVDG